MNAKTVRLLLTIIFALSTYPVSARDTFPLRIAVIDSPVEMTHEMLTPFTDFEQMNGLMSENKNETWAQAAQRSIDDYQKEIALHGKTPDQLSRISHGTHVAGLTIQGSSPENIKLLYYPFLNVRQKMSLTKLLSPDFLRNETDQISKSYRAINLGLKQAGVRIANLSYGATSDGIRSLLESQIDWSTCTNCQAEINSARANLRGIAEELVRIHYGEMRNMISQNPDTVFVISAGNDGADLAHEYFRERKSIRQRNVIIVAATNHTGKLANFSNYSDHEVDLAAPGVDLWSAKIGGGMVKMSGTSMSAPVVTHSLSQTWLAHPDYSSEKAIQAFYDEQGVSHFGLLAGKIIKGRFLPAQNAFKRGADGAGCADVFNSAEAN